MNLYLNITNLIFYYIIIINNKNNANRRNFGKFKQIAINDPYNNLKLEFIIG